MTPQSAVAAANVTDEELVRRVQQGETEAYNVLVNRHQRPVYWVIQGILHNHADSEEVLQESFLKALEHIGDFRGEARFSTWLIRIAINEAHMRQRKYRPGLYESIEQPPEDVGEFRPREFTDWRPNPEEVWAKEEMAALLRRGIRSLPPMYRSVFLLRDVEHLSVEESATALGLTIPATKTRLLRARLMMREYLAPYFKMGWRHRLLARVKGEGRPL